MKEKEQSNLNHVIARWQATHHIEFCEFANMRAERRNRKTGEIRRLCDYDGTNVPRNDKAQSHGVPRHCEEGVARRGNPLSGLLRHFVVLNFDNSQKRGFARLDVLGGLRRAAHLSKSAPRNDGISSTPQSLINDKGLARASRGRALSSKMTKSLQTTSADPFNASEQDFAYLPIRLFALKHASTQIIRGAAKARFRRTLRAGLADARTAPYRKFGFTLAEILVTLAVIGIVAAMTIPNLVQSYKKKVVETKLAKFYSIMNNAIKLAEVDYGPQSTWTDYHITQDYDDEHNMVFDKGDKYDVVVKKYFAPYLKITGSEEFNDVPITSYGGPQKVYYLSDGSAFGFSTHENREIYFYPNNPQKCLQNSNDSMGSCRFVFAFLPIITYDYDKRYKYNRGNGMQPNLLDWDGKEDSLNNNSKLGCKNGNGWYCTEVIRRNDWKIPDNYPYKF